MVINSKQRVLEKLAFRYHLKDKTRTSEENWKKAEELLSKIEKRLFVVFPKKPAEKS